jgi:anhydro-N-acetylmuramic acid kinase
MSGTSLDGLDICLARFTLEDGKWNAAIESTETISYSEKWKNKLVSAEKLVGSELMELHSEYGKFLGEQVNSFLTKIPKEKYPEIISSHGHTIFHRPAAGYTFQLGDGKSIFSTCKIPVVCDFRSGDVALGGQGAPLVPIGDRLLFFEYDYCLNLGGFANISFEKNGKRIAFDICPVNYVLNRLANRMGKDFDENGKLAASGKIIPELLEKLNSLSFYKKSPPKSLGREWVEETIFPLLSSNESRSLGTENLLRTFIEHVAEQISLQCNSAGEMLVTGGGSHNDFLISRLKEKCEVEIIIPDKKIVDFKEALIFAFLGLLRWRNEINILSSVTGAQGDSSSGEIFR